MKRVRAEVLSSRNLGSYHTLTIVAPEMAQRARPGQFLHVAVPSDRVFLLRRPFAIHKVSRQGGWAGTLEFAVGGHGPGSSWLRSVRAHEFLDVIGPLGKGFAYPRRGNNCLLVGEGYAAGQLYFLAEELRAQGRRVDMIIGGRSQHEVFKPIEGKRLSSSVTIVTRDGSLGERGRIVDVLPGVIGRCRSNVVYAAASRAVLRAVAEFCRRERIPSQVAVEEAMGCGWGQCLACVVPVAKREGEGLEYLRSCVEGPVLNSSRIAWNEFAPLEGANS